MAVVKEYRCTDCNRIFDSTIPSCIHCGSTNVQRVFVTPFGFKSDRTKFSDDNLEHLASSYKLNDFSNNESTKHTPDPGNHWAEVGGADVKGLLPAVAGGSFKVENIKGKAAGTYTATGHRDDKT